MGVWNNNDREESKPQFLNKTEKRHVVRTIRGWEMPLMGSPFAYGVTNGNSFGGGAGITFASVFTEVIVTLPNDPSIAGVTSSNYANGFTGDLNGLTFGSDQQDQPYFSAPFLGDGGITGVPGAAQLAGSTGVSHGFLTYVPGFDSNGYGLPWGSPGATPAGLNATGPGAGRGYQYGVNAYGVSTLGGLTGVTAYIKIQGHDTNLSQSLTIGLSGTYSGMALYTGISLTAGTNLAANHIPVDVYKVFFGPTGDKNGRVSYRQDNIAVLVVGGLTATGTKTVSLTIRDNSNSTAPFGGVTGATAGTTFALVFDRAAGLTTGGGTAGDGVTAPTFGQYFYTNTSTVRI
jgi:hypothetical protein